MTALMSREVVDTQIEHCWGLYSANGKVVDPNLVAAQMEDTWANRGYYELLTGLENNPDLSADPNERSLTLYLEEVEAMPVALRRRHIQNRLGVLAREMYDLSRNGQKTPLSDEYLALHALIPLGTGHVWTREMPD